MCSLYPSVFPFCPFNAIFVVAIMLMLHCVFVQEDRPAGGQGGPRPGPGAAGAAPAPAPVAARP